MEISKINGKLELAIFEHDVIGRHKKEKERKENIENLLVDLKHDVSRANDSIKILNRILRLIKLNNRVEEIRFSEIKSIINKRLSEFYPTDRERKLADENFNFKIFTMFQKTNKSLYEISRLYHSKEKIENLDKIPQKYQDDIKEAIDINSIGYPQTGIFVIGRTIEKCADDLIKKYIKLKKLKRIDVKKTKFENKIEILKANKIINVEQWHEFHSLRIDRNITGHPSTNLYVLKKTFKKNLLLAIDLMMRLKNRLKQ